MDTETEQIPVSARQLHNMLSTNEQYKKESEEKLVKLNSELLFARKHVASDEQLIEQLRVAMLKQKSELDELKREHDRLKQIGIEKAKTRPNHTTVTDALQRIRKYDEYIQQNRDKLIDDEFKKSYSEELELVRARNQKIMSMFK
jgi:hypothetical protein